MKHFENNVNDGMSRTDSIETLIDPQQAMDFDDETGEVWDD